MFVQVSDLNAIFLASPDAKVKITHLTFSRSYSLASHSLTSHIPISSCPLIDISKIISSFITKSIMILYCKLTETEWYSFKRPCNLWRRREGWKGLDSRIVSVLKYCSRSSGCFFLNFNNCRSYDFVVSSLGIRQDYFEDFFSFFHNLSICWFAVSTVYSPFSISFTAFWYAISISANLNDS